jgi:hypothetical protein
MIDTFVCLLLHVLIGDNDEIVVDDEDDAHSIGSWVEQSAPDMSTWGKIKSFLSRSNKTDEMVKDAETAAGMDEPQTLRSTPIAQHSHPDRAMIYDQVKSTRMSTLTVAVEQVSIFLTADGTVITFFQVYFSQSNFNQKQSGNAIERPIIQRLSSESTILRTSEDPSLLLQSIIDAVVDLSFPIATAYQELIADLVSPTYIWSKI